MATFQARPLHSTIAGARPQSLAFACALACLIGLGCTSAEAVTSETELDAALVEQARLEARVAELEAKQRSLAAELKTERGCRAQLVDSLSAFADGPYTEIVGDVASEALTLLEDRVAARKRGEKLAVVFDVDETVLSNIEQLEGSGYCFVRKDWNAWVESGAPSAMAGIKAVYDYAQAHEIAVVLITGRKASQREATERALRSAGFDGWDALIVRDKSEQEMSASEYKSGRRAKLEREGYTVVLNLGDQHSDLDGGHAERTLLMPNPFYFVD